MLKHYVEFYLSGDFYSGEKIEEIPERNENLITIPRDCFAYCFFDRNETIIDEKTVLGKEKNFSPITYFGVEYTLAEIKIKFPELKNLIYAMKCNGWDRMVRTHNGMWKYLEEGDIVKNVKNS